MWLSDKEIKAYVKARDKAILSFNVDKMRKFYAKYQHLMQLPFIPSDVVIYAGSMKAVKDIASATPEQKKKARDWLIKNGFEV